MRDQVLALALRNTTAEKKKKLWPGSLEAYSLGGKKDVTQTMIQIDV